VNVGRIGKLLFAHADWHRPRVSLKIAFLLLTAVLGLTVALLAWLGYKASREWRNSATMVLERRVDEVGALLINALIRDMAGAQESILIPLTVEQVNTKRPYEIRDNVSRAFTRFPYPESFFAWRAEPQTGAGTAIVFNRSDRPPAWEKTTTIHASFPVTIIRDSPVAEKLVEFTMQYASNGIEFAAFETSIGDLTYHVIARFFYKGKANRTLAAVVGFTVSVDWVRTAYLSELIHQVERIGGNAGARTLSLSIRDADGTLVTETRAAKPGGPVRDREFRFAFFDPSSIPAATLGGKPFPRWTARVATAEDPLLEAAEAGARRTLILIVIAAAVSIVSLLLAFRTFLTNFQLMAMKADFVAMVSHELKTPLASIHLVGETLSKGRYSSAAAITEYGALVAREATRLTRLIENILTVARIIESGNVYRMTDVDLSETLTETLARLEPQIRAKSMEVKCQVSEPLSIVSCDREAMINVFENLIENALKYSDGANTIEIHAFDTSEYVKVSVRDNGRGIPQEDLPHIFDRFFRAKNAGFGGSGLGLNIARRIVKDHRGEISVESISGKGTVITVAVPIAEVNA
jgi:signal transduction histidine kinase